MFYYVVDSLAGLGTQSLYFSNFGRRKKSVSAGKLVLVKVLMTPKSIVIKDNLHSILLLVKCEFVVVK